ncbi:MAG: tail fiber domain-containing protein [Limisphaerales bacterium]
MKTQFLSLWAALALSAGASQGLAQGTAFTYQGRLTDGASPANGTYDLLFELYSDDAGANQIGGALTNSAISVANGLFAATLDFGSGSLPGADRWLGIAVRTNGGGGFTALRPLQKLTPTPYAVTAATAANLTGSLSASQLSGVLPAGLLSGTYGDAVSFTNRSSRFAGDGSGLTGVNAATLGGASATGFWSTAGNAGASPANGAFLGTTDGQPLELRVNGARALRLEPGSGSPNVIGGATNNAVAAGVSGAVIAGGVDHYIDVASPNSAIGGGATNTIQDSAGASTIAGGAGNLIQTAASDSTIGGGEGNLIAGNAIDTTIGGGNSNTASGPSETIGGGEFNTAGGYAGTVPGGAGNTAGGDYSFAAGYNATAADDGSFVWADSVGYAFSSSAANQFSVRATGGVRFVSSVDSSGNPKAGVSLAAGGGSWASLSDRDSKENVVAVDAGRVLDRLAELPIATWNYKSQEPSVRHIGPMAQDFFTAFGVGEDQRHITGVDADGVALAAVQGLNRKLETSLAQKEAQILELRRALMELKGQVERLSK